MSTEIVTASSNGDGGMIAALARHKCRLVGWIIAWASFTFAGAAVRLVQTGGDAPPRAVPGMVFAIADRVPPHAKITFGVVFLLLLYAVPRLWPRGGYGMTGMLAGWGAGVAALCLVPFDYFTGASGGFLRREGMLSAAPHLLIAIGAGVVWMIVRRRCERAGAKPNA